MMKKPSFMSFSPGASVVPGAGVKVIEGKDAANSVGCKKISIPPAFRRPFTGSLLIRTPVD
jgi:hypothetical protein